MDRFRLFIVAGVFLLLSGQVVASQDPTAPLNWLAPKAQESKKAAKEYKVPKLQSIVCREESLCHAVLDNELVNVNDAVNGYTVSDITATEVTVVRAGRSHQLVLFKSEIKN